MTIKERIDLINNTIETLEKERTHIQNKICEHKNTSYSYWSDYPGRRFVAEVCDDCGKLIDNAPNPGLYKEVQIGNIFKIEKVKK